MLGHKGRGSYSPKRLYSTNVQELIPNIESMSPREFEKFLTKLRESRGEFGEHLRGVMRRRAGENGADGEKSMFELALQNAEETDYYMAFIGVRTAKEYRRTLQDDLKAVKDAQSSTDYSTRVKHYPIHDQERWGLAPKNQTTTPPHGRAPLLPPNNARNVFNDEAAVGDRPTGEIHRSRTVQFKAWGGGRCKKGICGFAWRVIGGDGC